jgi:hypothetical protein
MDALFVEVINLKKHIQRHEQEFPERVRQKSSRSKPFRFKPAPQRNYSADRTVMLVSWLAVYLITY